MNYLRVFEEFCGEAMQMGEDYRCPCPFHQQRGDSDRDFSFSAEKGVYKCHSAKCGESGTVVDLAGKLSSMTYQGSTEDKRDAIAEIFRRFPNEDEIGTLKRSHKGDAAKQAALPTEAQIQSWHRALLNTPEALLGLTESRKWSLEIIKKHKIGWAERREKDKDGNLVSRFRYRIPIYEDGVLVNVRSYWKGAPKGEVKIKGLMGRNRNRVWPQESLGYPNLFLCEGESDCLAMLSCGAPAITFTGGAGNIPKGDLSAFGGKTMVICYDADQAGKDGALKAASALRKYTNKIKILDISPLLIGGGNDLTDAIVAYPDSTKFKKDFFSLAKTAQWYQPEIDNKARSFEADFQQSMDADYIRRALSIQAVVMGMYQQPYDVVKKLKAKCDFCRSGKVDEEQAIICQFCPLFRGPVEHEMDPISDQYLCQIQINKRTRRAYFAGLVGALCDKWVEDPESDRGAMFEVTIAPEVRSWSESDDDIGQANTALNAQRSCYVITNGEVIQLNHLYKLTGTAVPQPWDQRTTNLFHAIEPTDNQIDRFTISKEASDAIDEAIEALRVETVDAEFAIESVEF